MPKPPQTGSGAFASRVDPGPSGGIFAECNAAEASGLQWMARVIKVDRVSPAGAPCLGKPTNADPDFRSYFSSLVPSRILSVQCLVQIESDARAVLYHLESDRDLPAEELLLGIDANIEIVEQQVVVGAVWAVARRRMLA
jgi:hypothetical protein